MPYEITTALSISEICILNIIYRGFLGYIFLMYATIAYYVEINTFKEVTSRRYDHVNGRILPFCYYGHLASYRYCRS